MAKFIEIYFHTFNNTLKVYRNIINVDEISKIEEYKQCKMDPGGLWKEYTECILITKDGTKYILEENVKEKIIKQLLEL